MNAALGILAILQVLDALTTHRILSAGGREMNPVMRWAFGAIGFWPAIAIKGAALVTLAAWLGARAGPIPPALMVAMYCAVVLWNWRQIRR